MRWRGGTRTVGRGFAATAGSGHAPIDGADGTTVDAGAGTVPALDTGEPDDEGFSPLQRRLERRGFLARAALAGSAMTVAPLRFLLKPGTAYAAICGCAGGRDCDCGSACCDGYTEFCCTLTGVNGCPPGSVVAGWWKADGSGLCPGPGGADSPRYYLDCNATAAGPCGASGVTSATNDCGCDCAGGDCGLRKTCCTAFRYGQCNQTVPCLGPIVCRIVTCTAPWTLEPSCTTAPATDDFTRFHDAPCLHTSPTPVYNVDAITQWGSLPVVFRDGFWYRGFDRVTNGDFDQPPLQFGAPGHVPITGDWNGDGSVTPGVFVDGGWHLRNSSSSGGADAAFTYGAPGHRPVTGDWDGDRVWGIGVVVGNLWLLRRSPTTGDPDIVFTFGSGAPGGVPVVGDWNGDGKMTPGWVEPTSSGTWRWSLRNSLTSGPADITFEYGSAANSVPVVGDWNLDGRWGIGMVAGNRWMLRNNASAGGPDLDFTLRTPPGTPLAWAARIRS